MLLLQAAYSANQQYMFGPDLLVSPVTKAMPSGSSTVNQTTWLPPDTTWLKFNTTVAATTTTAAAIDQVSIVSSCSPLSYLYDRLGFFIFIFVCMHCLLLSMTTFFSIPHFTWIDTRVCQAWGSGRHTPLP
jgi:hypothetical protein